MTAYDFFSPRQIVFGTGRRAEAGTLGASLGKRGFLLGGSHTLRENGCEEELIAHFNAAGVEVITLGVIDREPEVEDVDDTVTTVLNNHPTAGDFLIGFGGGSAIDLAKAVAARITNRDGDSVQDYLEGVGKGLTITAPPLPIMAIPTTAGTGTEATKNAVISCYDPLFKKSLRSPMMIPDLVLIDPELTVSVSARTTAHTGMDAITQLIESYISRRAKPIPQALCIQGLQLAWSSLEVAVSLPENLAARQNMSHAALLSGMALANSGLGMAHGVAAALGVHCKIPHGLACAVMLPVALRTNLETTRQRLNELATATIGQPSPEAFIEHIEALADRIHIPRKLSELEVTADQLPSLVASSRGNSMNGNPRELSDTELHSILEQML